MNPTKTVKVQEIYEPVEDKVEQAVEELRKNEVSEEQLKAFDEWIEERKAEAKAEAERVMNEPIEDSPLPF